MLIISLGKQYAYMYARTKEMNLVNRFPRGVCVYLAITKHYVFLYMFDTFNGYKPEKTPAYSVDLYFIPKTMRKLLAPYLRPYKDKISKEYWEFL